MEKRYICSIGTGVIGSSMPVVFAIGNYDVKILAENEEEIEKAKVKIKENVDTLLSYKIVSDEETEAIFSHLSYTTNVEEAFKSCFYVQENLPDNIRIKQAFIEYFSKYAPDDAIFASSTSGIKIDHIASDFKCASRIIGAHPSNPPHIIPLVDIVKGEKSSQEAIDIAKEIFKNCRKEPIIMKKQVRGFVSNRLQAALFREVTDMILENIISLEDADKAVTYGPGIRWGVMGPGMLLELSGGEGGIETVLEHIGPSMENWLLDLAKWTKIPETAKSILPPMAKEEMYSRSEKEGNTRDTMLKYRDDMVVEILKLHGKF